MSCLFRMAARFPGLKSLLCALPGGGWRSLLFVNPPHPSLDFACAAVCIPRPPVPCSSLWDTSSCSLRLLHLQWLRRRCHLALGFPVESAGVFGAWLREASEVESKVLDGATALSLSFT